MLRSMTGYGRGEAQKNGFHYVVEIKSVNNRFLDAGLKLPVALWPKENAARSLIGQQIVRGRVDVLWHELGTPEGEAAPSIAVNHNLAKAYAAALKELSKALKFKDKIKLEQVARFPEVIQGAGKREIGPDEAERRWECLEQALRLALQSLNASREREGQALKEELEMRLKKSAELVEAIEGQAGESVKVLKEKQLKRLTEMLERLSPEDPRLLMEAAILAERADIREELVRFRAHLQEFARLLGAPDAVGKRLDFLTQELLRETNTMGSKSADAKLAHFVVELKGEIEKIKEQVQNLE